MSDQTELLAAAENCPFCGCEPIGYEIEPHSHALAKFMPDHPGSYVIECPPCDFYMSKPTKAEAIAAWNRRSPPVKAQAEREGEDAEPVAGSLDANELWEFLFGRLKGAVPDELTDEVLSELASHVRSVWPAATLASPLPVEPVDHIADASGQVTRGGDQTLSAIPEVSDASIAVGAEQPTDLPGLMIVVDMEEGVASARLVTPADSAASALPLQDIIVLVGAEAKPGEESPGASFAGGFEPLSGSPHLVRIEPAPLGGRRRIAFVAALAELRRAPAVKGESRYRQALTALGASPLLHAEIDKMVRDNGQRAGKMVPVEPVTVDEGMVGWRDIETDPPPKDGSNVLLYADGVREYARYVVGHWGKALLTPAQWFDYAGTKPLGLTPTHWRPLPTPPSALHHGGGSQ